MTTTRLAALLLVPALFGTGCVVAQTRTRTWSDQGQAENEQTWHGQVTQIRETVEELRGDPAAGAVAGAVVGGVVGSALSGGRGGGGFLGAVTGAMIGADASRGGGARWIYEVTVRYDDGSLRTYSYAGQAPFRVGDEVILSSSGLARL
jgi:outer membrane lipoprotein SlyB